MAHMDRRAGIIEARHGRSGSRAAPADQGALPAIAGVLYDGRWRILAAMLAWLVLAIVYALVCTPLYRADVLLAPANSRGPGSFLEDIGSQVNGLAALAGVRLSQDEPTTEALAILESREFSRAFILRHGLVEKLAPDPWLRLPWHSGKPMAAERRLRAAVDRFDRRIRRVQRDARTGLVTVTIDWRDPREAAAWANDLVAALNAEVRERTIRETTQNLKYLEDELNRTRIVGVERAIFRIVEAQVNRRMLASAHQEVAFKVIDPAIVPGEEDRVWPRRSLIVIAGLAIGVLTGVLLVLVPDALRRLLALARSASSRSRPD